MLTRFPLKPSSPPGRPAFQKQERYSTRPILPLPDALLSPFLSCLPTVGPGTRGVDRPSGRRAVSRTQNRRFPLRRKEATERSVRAPLAALLSLPVFPPAITSLLADQFGSKRLSKSQLLQGQFLAQAGLVIPPPGGDVIGVHGHLESGEGIGVRRAIGHDQGHEIVQLGHAFR